MTTLALERPIGTPKENGSSSSSSSSLDLNQPPALDIVAFLRDKNIFITGTTGFLAKGMLVSFWFA